MKFNFSFFILMVLTPSHIFGQTTEKYEYKSQLYYECLKLDARGKFQWEVIIHPSIQTKVVGNWQRRNDTLILDSSPQHDKMLVFESKNRSRKTVFSVKDKRGNPFNFSIIICTQSGDTVEIRDQYMSLKISKSVGSFCITNGIGMSSPFYQIQGLNANKFLIYFDDLRIFENEAWFFKGEEIVPTTSDGKLKKYTLRKL